MQVPAWKIHVCNPLGCIEDVELAPDPCAMLRGDASNIARLKESLQTFVAEARDHTLNVTLLVTLRNGASIAVTVIHTFVRASLGSTEHFHRRLSDILSRWAQNAA